MLTAQFYFNFNFNFDQVSEWAPIAPEKTAQVQQDKSNDGVGAAEEEGDNQPEVVMSSLRPPSSRQQIKK